MRCPSNRPAPRSGLAWVSFFLFFDLWKFGRWSVKAFFNVSFLLFFLSLWSCVHETTKAPWPMIPHHTQVVTCTWLSCFLFFILYHANKHQTCTGAQWRWHLKVNWIWWSFLWHLTILSTMFFIFTCISLTCMASPYLIWQIQVGCRCLLLIATSPMPCKSKDGVTHGWFNQ